MKFIYYKHRDVLRLAHALTRKEPSAERYAARLGRNISKVYAKVREARLQDLKDIHVSHKITAMAVTVLVCWILLGTLSLLDVWKGAVIVAVFGWCLKGLWVIYKRLELKTPSSSSIMHMDLLKTT